uniref:RNI-like leucine-rich repeat-protein A n=1 Tax=Raperostelium minutum TaxID=35219 RepID=H9A2L6_9MYCE|nr:RNI-like leucine-rich repeat-protein A [Raperostelium minutum]
MSNSTSTSPTSTPDPEIETKYIEDSLGVVGGVFGEEITHTVWLDANKSPNSTQTGFNKRCIVVGRYKLLSIKKGTFGKSIEAEFHLYNIIEISQETDDIINIKYSNENNEQLGITVKGSLEKLQGLLLAIRASYRRITVGFTPESCMKLTVAENKLLELKPFDEISDANGFIDCYIAHSYFYKTISTLDFIRYIQALFHTDSEDLDFTQCAGIDPTSELSFNLFTAISSLRHNTYFKSANLSGLPHANIVSALAMCLETNKTLTQLNLSNLRIEQSFQPIANALNKNTHNSIQSLDLSKNTITLPVMQTLCDSFAKLPHALVSLNLSKCDLQPRNIQVLFEAFERNFGMSLSLRYLNLSHNKFADQGSQSFASWMAKIKGYHSLECLVLSNCQLNFTIMGPPLRVVDVAKLDLSNNKIDRTSSKLLGSEVMDSVVALTYLNLSGCNLNADSLEDLFVSFNRNRKIAHFNINLSRNNLSSREATLLSKSISGCRYLEALDISYNKLTCKSIMEILNAIKNIDNFNLHELNISNNYFVQGQEGDQLCSQLASLINSFPTIRTLNVSGGRYPLGKSLTPLLEALIKNKSLKELDISENGLTDQMASIIGEMLRNNTTLIYLNIDSNLFGLSGLTSIAQPLLYDINRKLNYLVFTKLLASAYSSTLIQNFTLHQSFGSLSKEKRNQLIQLFQKMQDKLAENRFETSMELDSNGAMIYYSEYANISNVYTIKTPESLQPLKEVPEHLSCLPPPSSNGSSNTTTPLNGSLMVQSDSEKKQNTSPSSNTTIQPSNSSNNLLNVVTNQILPPKALVTETGNQSDWQPDESSEFDPYESSTEAFNNYSSENDDDVITYDDSDEYESSSSEYNSKKPHSKLKSKPKKSSSANNSKKTSKSSTPPVSSNLSTSPPNNNQQQNNNSGYSNPFLTNSANSNPFLNSNTNTTSTPTVSPFEIPISTINNNSNNGSTSTSPRKPNSATTSPRGQQLN